MALFPTAAELAALVDADAGRRAGTRWSALRERVLAEIEPLRKNKQIGSSLQAKVVLSAHDAPSCALLEQYAQRPADAVHRLGGGAASGADRRRGARAKRCRA